ncbi:MAG: FtsX-like permease family protein [Leifsonia sp.]
MTRRSVTSAPALVRRHLRAHPAGGITVAMLVVLIAVIAAAAPRSVEAMHTRAIGFALGAIDADQRDITGDAIGIPDPGASDGSSELSPASDAAWGAFDGAVRAVRSGLPSPLREATGEPQYFLSVDAFPIVYPGSGHHTKLSLAFDPRSDQRVRYLQGAAPAATSDDVLEVSLATENADALEWSVGDTRTVETGEGSSITARLSGVFDPEDPTDGYWSHAPLLTTPSIMITGLGPPIYTGTGIVDASELGRIAGLAAATRLSVWFPVDPAAVTSANAADVVEQMRRFDSAPPTIEVSRTGYGPSPLTFTSGAADTIDDTLARDAAVDAVLAMTASGPAGVMIAVLLLGCRIIARRRGDAMRLLAARGASPGDLRGLLLVEGLVVGVPAAIVGTLIGLAISTGAVEPDQLVLPLIAGLLPAVLLGLGPVDSARSARHDLDEAGAGRVRVVIELVVVGLAVVATAALLQRGLTTAAASAGVDPLLAAVPLLLSLAACVGALRLYPLPLAWLAGRFRRRPGLSAFLGPVRALRDPATGLVPVLALVVGVAVAVSSSVLLSTIRVGIDDAAVTAVGADLRVSGIAITAEQVDAITEIRGVEAAATASGPKSLIIDAGGRRTNTSVVVADMAAIALVQAGQPGALPIDAALTQDGPTLPVLAAASTASAIGNATAPELDGEPITIVATVDGPTPLSSRGNWVLLDSAFAKRAGVNPVTHTMLLRLDPGASTDDVTAAVEAVVGQEATVTTPGHVAAVLRATPTATGLQTALLVAIAVSGLLSAIAIAMTLVLGSDARGRILSVLRALGAGRSQARALPAWEIGPPAAVALVVGAVLGVILPAVILAGVDVRGFTGGRAQPALAIDPLATLGLVLGFVFATAAFTIIALGTSRRVRASTILRTVEDA